MVAHSLSLGAAMAVAVSALSLPTTISIRLIRPGQLASLMAPPALQAPPAPAVAPPQVVPYKLDCTDCPFATGRSITGIVWSQTPVKNYLALNFQISDDQSKLSLNGVQVYPPEMGFFSTRFYPSFPKRFTALQLPVDTDADANKSKGRGCHKRRLPINGYSWKWGPNDVANSEGAQVIPGVLDISRLANRSVHIPSVAIKLIKDIHGKLTIESVTTGESSQVATSQAETTVMAPHHADAGSQCNGPAIFCKLRFIMAQMGIGLKKNCRKMGHRMRHPKHWIVMLRPHRLLHPEAPVIPALPSESDHEDSTHNGDAVQVHQPAHHHHHHHHGFHRLVSVVARGGAVVLLPMLIGVAAGFLVYIVGVSLGLFVAFAWVTLRKWRSRRHRGVYGHVSPDEHAAFATEQLGKDPVKAGFTDEEALEAPPVYYDVVEKEVVTREES